MLLKTKRSLGISLRNRATKNLTLSLSAAGGQAVIAIFQFSDVTFQRNDRQLFIWEWTKSGNEYDGEWGIETIHPYDELLGELEADNIDVVGATTFAWCRPDFVQSVDVLIVDETGQMSLADTLAAARACESMVLLGDPQQLEQPLQSNHAEGSDVSALYHWLNGSVTMTPDLGLFLPETHRLHPDIALFTSEIYYEDKLTSATRTCESGDHRQVWFKPRFGGFGVEVHRCRTYRKPSEIR